MAESQSTDFDDQPVRRNSISAMPASPKKKALDDEEPAWLQQAGSVLDVTEAHDAVSPTSVTRRLSRASIVLGESLYDAAGAVADGAVTAGNAIATTATAPFGSKEGEEPSWLSGAAQALGLREKPAMAKPAAPVHKTGSQKKQERRAQRRPQANEPRERLPAAEVPAPSPALQRSWL
jgi:hypothetical protein